jgi:hypothetical protein
MSKKPAAVQVAKEHEQQDGTRPGRIVERWGVRARLVQVPEGVLEDAERRIKDPDMPIIKDEAEGTEYENPNDPAYLRGLDEANTLRGIAGIEAMCLFGVELLDGLPQQDTWRKKLQYMEKRGHIDLSWVDWDDPMEVEFVFIRYAFLTMDHVTYLGTISRMTQEELKRAEASFQRPEV